MTNRFAIILGLLILAAISFDALVADFQGITVLGQKFLLLINTLKFWR